MTCSAGVSRPGILSAHVKCQLNAVFIHPFHWNLEIHNFDAADMSPHQLLLQLQFPLMRVMVDLMPSECRAMPYDHRVSCEVQYLESILPCARLENACL